MKVIAIMILLMTQLLSAKEKEADCYAELTACRSACYATADITSDCILECYAVNSKCLKEKFK